jgi:nucleoid DNA-binding protein
MTKRELLRLLSKRHLELPVEDVRYCVDIMLGAIAASLGRGDRAEFRSFGVFRTFRSKAKLGRNPLKGTPVIVPSKNHVRFRSTMKIGQTVSALKREVPQTQPSAMMRKAAANSAKHVLKRRAAAA